MLFNIYIDTKDISRNIFLAQIMIIWQKERKKKPRKLPSYLIIYLFNCLSA